ncbi:hypothetical protein Hanom_Chr07g00620451 [Helianthus anomalus]
MELCRFTDPEIDRLRHGFPEGTVFKPFASSMKSDCISDVWITFPAFPFHIGFTYPFPFFTQSFITLTGLCYVQAMPMVWRVFHGSHRFLFKSKPGQAHPIPKTTKNVSNWRNQFLFVGRDSIPNESHLPKKWITQAISFSHIQESPVTRERIAAFWKLDPAIRTFQAKPKDSQEISSGSYTMSSKYPYLCVLPNLPSLLQGSVWVTSENVSPRSIKKELAASQSIPEIKGISTRGKGTKRKKPSEPTKGLPLMERQLHEYISEKFAKVQILLDQHVAEAEQKSIDLQAIAVAKDKKISSIKRRTRHCKRSCL